MAGRASSAARQTVSGYLPYVSGPTGNRTRISATPGRRLPVGRSAHCSVDLIGVEPITPILQGSVAAIGMQAHSVVRSVRELNQRSSGPRPDAITRLRHVPIVSSPCGSRTQPARLERPMTSPEVERAVLYACGHRKAGREPLESSSAALQTAATPYQPPARLVGVRARKNPMSLMTPGF